MASTKKDLSEIVPNVTYKTSSLCNHGECIAVGALTDGSISIKDTKALEDKALTFTLDEWDAFVKGVKNGEFDQLGRS